MPAQTVHTEQSGRVLTVRLDNPPRNFMTTAMVGELEALVSGLESDSSIGSVIFTGAPDDVFITHFDVDEILGAASRVGARFTPAQTGGGLRAVGAVRRVPGARGALARTPAAGLEALIQIHDVFLRMNRLDKVVIAAINGVATGGGCELALACDLRLMSEDGGPIGLPEITLGIIPGAGGTQRMTRALGPARALETMLEARLLSPGEALEVGLVHQVVPAAELMTQAEATARRLARRSPAAVRGLKRAVYEGGSAPLAAGLHLERSEFMAAASTAAAKIAMRQYAGEVRTMGGAPWASSELVEAWQDGTAVDMTDGR